MKAVLSGTVLHSFALAGLVFLSGAAQSSPIELVKNGGFEASTGTGLIGYNTVVDNWSSPYGYNFLFEPGKADTVGAKTWWAGDYLQLWGANNGGANALAVSANGGNFIAADGVYGYYGYNKVAPIQQMIHGMVVGQTYALSFEWAAAQQHRFSGANSEWWNVSIDGNSFRTATYQNQDHASSNWMRETFTFTAKASDSLLSFLAAGTPQGFPPFSLLDGVSLTAVERGQAAAEVPEPASWMIMLSGLALLWGALRRRHGAKR